jgi:catechol 2,3-dioxygenase-like lactoylglutathione lyase family enzyme
LAATAIDDRPSAVPIDHVNIPVAYLAVSRDFYSAVPAPLGFRLVYDGEESLGFGRGAAPKAGGREFVIDPDGHNIEAVFKGGA